ncbi:unnamed protein product [Penicillium camemberti]|uniref:Str. FM013 n=1 Tax=Penicillium camemberti (strain FM 013) TaxID=1429867 RepID=A0A0G4PUL5_PENC3|nr:unnamed protein product [Penicillium camemberti]
MILHYYPSSVCKLTCDCTTSRLLRGIYCLEGMTYTSSGYEDTYRSELSDLWERNPSYARNPSYLDRECTPSVFCASPGPEESSLPLQPSQSNELLPVVEGMEEHGIDNLRTLFTTRSAFPSQQCPLRFHRS